MDGNNLDPFTPDLFPVIKLAPLLTDSTGRPVAELAPAKAPRIAYIVGSDENEQIEHNVRVPIYQQGATDCDLQRVTNKTEYARIHITKNYFRQPFRYELNGYDCLLNLVTDPDQHPRVLRNMVRMLDGVLARVINDPAAVLRSTRDQVARRTAHIDNLHTPKTARVARGIV